VFGNKENIGIGVVGGLGPETTSEFYLNVVNKVCNITGKYPNIIIDNVPVSTELDESMISGRKSEKIFNLLRESVERLNKLNVSIIVIPCNTVHVFFKRLQRSSKVPMLSIIDETTFAAKSLGYKRIGLIATTCTISSKMYQKSFEKEGIDVVLPNKRDQNRVSRLIIKILRNKVLKNDRKFFYSLIRKLFKKGAEAILFGCTDLRLLINDKSEIKIIDSTKALEDATINFILKGQ